jgi:hypothetical protein
MKPDGSVLVEGKDVRMRLPDGSATATSVEFFMNVAFSVEGVYWVEILIENDLRLRYPLKASRVQQRPPEGGQPA